MHSKAEICFYILKEIVLFHDLNKIDILLLSLLICVSYIILINASPQVHMLIYINFFFKEYESWFLAAFAGYSSPA